VSPPFSPALNVPVLGFSLVLLTATVLFLGLVPAWLVSKTNLVSALRGFSGSVSGARSAGTFVVVQVAVALGLVSAGGLLVRSLAALGSEPLGFAPERVSSAYVTLPDTRYPTDEDNRQFRRRALEELATIPGVSSSATASHLPTTPMLLNLATKIEGRPLPRGTFRAAPVFVSRGLLRTLGIPILKGRGFDDRDRKNSPWVIIINERMAEDFWPGQDAIGKQVRLEYAWAPDAPLTVIGVVADVKQEGIGQRVRPSFYILHEQFPQEWFYFALRTDGAPDALMANVRERLRTVDASLPVTDMKTMSERISDSLQAPRARARLVGLYASAGLLIAALGLYGSLASLVAFRARELAIRMALGATRARVVRLVMGRGLELHVLGLGLGLVLAFLGRRFIESLLYGIAATDAMSLTATVAILAGVGLLAILIPAYQAARPAPVNRLRQPE